MQKLGGKDWRSENLLSLAGVYKPKARIEESSLPAALVQYLTDYPHIRKVVLRLDNDPAGRIAAVTIKTLLTKRYAVTVDIQPPPQGKGGIYFGENAISHNLIMCNKANLLNQSAFLLGVPGSGKSFSAKDKPACRMGND